MSKFLSILVAVVLIFGIAGGVLVGVADAAAPGDPLYGVDRGVEDLRLNLTTNPDSLQGLHEQFAQERLDEVQALIERGDQELLEQALEELGQALVQASGGDGALETASQEDQDLGEDNRDDGDRDDDSDADDDGDSDQDGEDDLKAYCDGESEKRHPAVEKLANSFEDVGYEKIIEWACSGYSFGDIKHAYSINQATGAPVEELFEKLDSGQEWGEIKQEYDLKGKGKGEGKEKPDDGDPDGDGKKQPKEGAYCDGSAEKNHPAAEKLAARYGVTYGEVLDRFCSGYGLGEIKLAYHISEVAEPPVDVGEIFALREEGMGWGGIMQKYGLTGKGKPPKEKAKGKPDDKGNKKPKPTKKPKP